MAEVSIVLPVYNVDFEQFHQCVDSIRKQTFQEYADIHGISSAAVNNMRNKAVAKLRASLEELSESTAKKKLRKK